MVGDRAGTSGHIVGSESVVPVPSNTKGGTPGTVAAYIRLPEEETQSYFVSGPIGAKP